MQRVAFISDIHGNLAALDAVLAEIDSLGIQNILCCGDVVGYGPYPRECVNRLREREIPTVLGNHDLYTLEARNNEMFTEQADQLRQHPVWAGILHAQEQLSADDFDWLVNLPMFLRLPTAIVGHAALHNIDEWPYLDESHEVLATLKALRQQQLHIGFFGHSHGHEWFCKSKQTGVKRVEKPNSVIRRNQTTAVVVGSVGQPRTGDPRAAWTVWDLDARRITFRRTEYPIDKTIKAIQEIGLPEDNGKRLWYGV